MSATQMPCPYCAKRFGVRANFRAHVADNVCGEVPAEVSLSILVTEAKDMAEAEFLARVSALVERYGGLVSHAKPLRGRDGRMMTNTARGFPDLTIVLPHIHLVVFLELKREKGSRTSDEQKVWVSSIQRCNRVEAYVVRPSDWPEVHHMLTEPCPPRSANHAKVAGSADPQPQPMEPIL